MKLLRKINTAFKILKKEGLGILINKTLADLDWNSNKFTNPDESKIVFEVLQAKRQPGVMIDIGAHYGGALAPFAHCGWQIYAFEPDAGNRKNLISKFGQATNVLIDSRAVSDQIENGVNFYTSNESNGISGLSSFHSSHEINGTVDTTTLADFMKQGGIKSVDFLKIDTEGFDFFVLKGFPWDEITPKAIVCEFEDSKTKPLGYSFHDLADFLQKQGYKLLISEWFPIKKYGQAHDWRCFAEYPCTLHDENGWGNIIAIKDQGTFNTLIKISKKIQRTGDNR